MLNYTDFVKTAACKQRKKAECKQGVCKKSVCKQGEQQKCSMIDKIRARLAKGC